MVNRTFLTKRDQHLIIYIFRSLYVSRTDADVKLLTFDEVGLPFGYSHIPVFICKQKPLTFEKTAQSFGYLHIPLFLCM